MAYASVRQNRGFLVLNTLRDGFAALSAAWSRSRTFTRTYNELNALSTRDLQDLGIHRSMISRLAHEAAYGRDS
ncbi:DUF1127 domain-containing protein [Pararhodobacter oceanensis]|uniref:YjiS-like domain-containing protein n=1 Tax=Pararhodobacter oceanensis TaxID=2172121 RepID=A0A2T8HYK3_9RHOB|nr:DUF1127 domain-containing protein [Pararhodobacter oceanensis]PVH30422.1 hypothetical protein DDE20_02435 [Pararhodobacter oceanensis]